MDAQTTSASTLLTIAQAMALLTKMEAAAPPGMAAKLGEIATLLQALSNDNEYLVGLYNEALLLPKVNSAVAEAAAPVEPEGSAEQRRDLALAEMDLFYVQMDERMRAPLREIQQANDGLADALLGVVPAEQEDQIQQISVNATVAMRLLDGMKTVIAIKSGLMDVTPLVFSVPIMMREAARLMNDRAVMRQQRLAVVYPPDELQAIGDYQQILVILLDLLENAIYYTPVGGSIWLSAENLGTHVLFSVQDTGIGFSGDEAAFIGQPFWRATYQPLVSQHPGAGLRLYLSRELLRLQRGEMVFTGEPNAGSTFSFTLPGAGT